MPNPQVITVSREYGAGGAEVAERVAAALGWELLDRELLHRAAAIEHVPDADLDRLDEHAIGLLDRFRLHPPHQRYLHGLTEAARQAAGRGHVVLVGRGIHRLLHDVPDALHVRLVAPTEWRVQRLARLQGWTVEQATERCGATDRTRSRFTHYFFGAAATDPDQFDFVANTAGIALDDVVDGVVQGARGASAADDSPGGRRVLTVSHQEGGRGTEVIAELARRLALHLCDGPASDEVELLDSELKQNASRGDVLLLGRGGNRILRDDPAAFRLRVVAPMECRVRQVMARHWAREAVARTLITCSDQRGSRFFERSFGGRWSDPLEYDLVINAARPRAIDLAVFFARRHWAQGGGGP